jgi:hypothetical protein
MFMPLYRHHRKARNDKFMRFLKPILEINEI